MKYEKKNEILFFLVINLLVAGALSLQVSSHSGTENEIVKARMASMKEIAANLKGLAKVSRGNIPFNLSEVKDMLSIIEINAAETPHLFEINATDPTSEAASEIWQNFQDFVDKSFALESTAKKLFDAVESVDDLEDAVKALGGECKACHSKYRN